MSSSPSSSPVFTKASTDKVDSVPSPIQIKHQQYHHQTRKFASHLSDNDDDDDDDDDVIEILDDQPSSSAFYEVNGLYFFFCS